MDKISTSEVLDWAKQFLADAKDELTSDELKEQHKYASLIQKPANKILLSKMLDESSQITDNKRLAYRLKVLIDQYGVPDFFNGFDQTLLRMFAAFGYKFYGIAVPIFKDRLRKETNKIIIAEERPTLTKHLQQRWNDRIGQNINLLGEVVLGNNEADNRYAHYQEALKEPDINYISVKISGIYAQIHPLSYDKSKLELCKRISTLFRCAIDNPYTDMQGNTRAKFVNLDMEEYKDAELTLDVFISVMSMPEFKNFTAGIVIQAYLPDAALFQERLLNFAKKRVAEGGSPIKMRLVKGANLQMETITSSLKGWENPVLSNKIEVDANYLHILDIALQPENAKAVHVGVASHNFFSIGYAYLLSEKNGISDYVTFEMLEGMANHLPRIIRKMDKHIILYTPVVKKQHFLNAVSYLVRRMDENTGKDNFLSYSFNLKLDSNEWNFLKEQFLQAYLLKDRIQPQTLRTQNRNLPPIAVKDITTFENEPDTDLDLEQNRIWALKVLKHWQTEVSDENFIVPIQIGDKEVFSENKRKYYDRSRNHEVCFCEANLSSLDQVKEIIAIAETDKSDWRKTTLEHRNAVLHRVADNMAANRGNLIGCMSAITGKTFMEGDVEISEGIDFCRFYPISLMQFAKLKNVTYSPKGIILVIPPWNFPFAIPVGGVAAALAGGNTVILKPATIALPIAWQFAQCFWNAGVPKDALQVVSPAERSTLNFLTSHPSIKQIIFTGGTDTAFHLLKNNPRCQLAAETGGKNAIILTGGGDRDHAILNAVSSAFGNAGQKCSACSLLLVAKEIYNDKNFQSKLKDAVTSIQTGSVWQPETIVGPMIDNNNEKLRQAIENLEEGESWLVAPEFVDREKYILKPCVKWGVKPNSYTFRTELFAPLLAVVCIDNLQQGVEFVNSLEYGLTSGLQSLDEKEIKYWTKHIEAGNLYIDRGITGAIVNRQPFGGMKRSAFGGGIKAGGSNYVTCFVNWSEKLLPATQQSTLESPFDALLTEAKCKNRLNYAFNSYKEAWDNEFSKTKDISSLYGEVNYFRYIPLNNCILRIHPEDDICDVLLIILAAIIANTPITISILPTDSQIGSLKTSVLGLPGLDIVNHDDNQFIAAIKNYDRIRSCSDNLSDAVYAEAAKLGLHIASEKPVAEGRIELLHYLKEQSISHEYHRYGSIFEDKSKI